MKETIQKAIEGGYERTERLVDERDFYVFLDVDFWKALSKAENWGGIQWYSIYDGFRPSSWTHRWHYEMHRFIDHLIAGGSPEEFFTKLLAEKR